MRRFGALLLAFGGGQLWFWGGVASAQQVAPAVDDLRTNDVTFEDGALSDRALLELDAAVAQVQNSDDGYLKVVVLGDPVSDFDSASQFAESVKERLGGRGRVIVFTPDEVAIASNADTASEEERAEFAAADRLNTGSSLAAATTAAAERLGIEPGAAASSSSSSSSSSDDGGGGGVPWLFLLLVIAIPLLLLFVMWRAARRQRERYAAVSAQSFGAAEAKVRQAVDKVANDVLELSDRIDQPDTSPEARTAFSQGAELFTETQALLEKADDRGELSQAYSQVVEAGWHLDVARARLDGTPEPAKPEPDELFPKPATTTTPASTEGTPADAAADAAAAPAAARPAPEPHYSQAGASPWITTAAMAALTLLSQRGMSVPRTRQPMDDGAFGSWMQGLPGMQSQPRSRQRVSASSSGRGFGRRSGGGVVRPASQSRGRGMGRR